MGTKAQTKPAINMAKDLKKGMFLRAKRNSTWVKKGHICRFHNYYRGYYNRDIEAKSFTTGTYSNSHPLADFEVITELEAAQDVVDKLKAKLATAEAKVDALKNPPWKVGDVFILGSGAVYVIHSMDAEVVTYKAKVSGAFYAKALKAFKMAAKRS